MATSNSSPSPSSDGGSRSSKSTTSRMMKTTKRGKPFMKDTHDLFATLIVSLQLTTHRQYFKTYHNSFTTDEAAENLSALKFSQSNRAPDPSEPSRVITTTTTTTFSMSRDMAKGICQHFMDAHLIENAADLSSPVFKDKGVYVITPKGLHILERFITKNGINAEHLLKVFSSQPICMKLLHLERNLNSDELVINQSVLQVIFRRFAGRRPNYPPIETETSSEFDRSLGVEVADIQEKIKGSKGVQTIQHTFLALTAVDWLCDFTTMSGREEAAELAAHFVRQRFVHLVYDKSRVDTDDNVITVHGDDGVGGTSSGDFRCHYKALYAFTDWGRSLARWPGYNSNESGQTTSFQSRESSSAYRDNLSGPVDESKSLRSHRDVPAHQGDVETDSSGQFYSPTTEATPPEVAGRTSSSQPKASNEHGRSGYLFAKEEHPSYTRDSNSTRLKQILEEPALRSLFRDFLKQNFCEENLSFWLDVQDFKRRFNTTSSAMAVQPNTTKGDGKGMTGMVRKLGAKNQSSAAKDASGQNAMEKHQQELVAMAFVIYNTYLAPSSSCELNIEHNLRSELVQYMSKLLADNRSSAVDQVHASDLPKESPNGSAQLEEKKKAVTAAVPRQPLHASQLQAMVRLYERIQDQIFRLMATDSVPRFIKDARFLNLVRNVEEYTEALEAGRIDPRQNSGPGLGKSAVDAMELGRMSLGESSNHNHTDGKEVLREKPNPSHPIC